MIVISEYRLKDEQIKGYTSKGYRFAYTYENPTIRYGEAVGILLKPMYKTTIELIERLLYFKHNVTLKYEEDSYKLNTLDDWKRTYQSDKDCLKMKREYHPILQEYYNKREEYFEKLNARKIRDQYEEIYINFGIDAETLPNELEVDAYLGEHAYEYQIDVDYSNNLSKLRAYYQIQYYIDHDIPKTIEEPEEVQSFGDEIYLEDYIYKNSSCI